MFALSEEDLNRRILGSADGPASFNSELTQRGGSMISCDPLYQFTPEQIRGHELVRQLVSDLFTMQDPPSNELRELAGRLGALTLSG